MKTKKQFFGMAIAIIAIAITAMSMTGCGDGDDNPTDNLSVPYGTLPNGVGIYKGDASITDAQMTTAVQNAIAGYNAVDTNTHGSPNGKFTKVIILSSSSGEYYTWDGSVLGIKVDVTTDGYFRSRFEGIADGTLSPK